MHPQPQGERPPSAAAWTTQRERSNLWTLKLMRWIAMALGRTVARAVLHPITLYFLAFGGTPARESARYLSRVFGRPARWRERYRHVHHFAATVLDRVYLLQEQVDRFDVQLTGLEHLDAVTAEGQGALLIGAHVGSFEVMRTLGQLRGGLRIAMAMYEDNARMVNETLRALAPHDTLHIIALGRLEAMLEMREWLDSGGVTGLLADRTFHGEQAERSVTRYLPFLGAPAPFPDGPFRLAALLKRRVIFMAGLYHGGNRYELRFAPLADFREVGRGAARDQAIGEAQARYAAMLEALCRETPYNWFNFFDFWGATTDRPA
jgi:predicted LPLAT superfamily acyltransferase